jgi:hypothetical protein
VRYLFLDCVLVLLWDVYDAWLSALRLLLLIKVSLLRKRCSVTGCISCPFVLRVLELFLLFSVTDGWPRIYKHQLGTCPSEWCGLGEGGGGGVSMCVWSWALREGIKVSGTTELRHVFLFRHRLDLMQGLWRSSFLCVAASGVGISCFWPTVCKRASPLGNIPST